MNNSSENTPTEYQEACTFVDWLELMKQQGKILDYCHIANESYGGTRADMLRGARLKRMGRKRGVFDYEIYFYGRFRYVVAEQLFNVPEYWTQELRVELKRCKGGVISDEQEHWQIVYRECGIPAKICKGADEAIEFVSSFID